MKWHTDERRDWAHVDTSKHVPIGRPPTVKTDLHRFPTRLTSSAALLLKAYKIQIYAPVPDVNFGHKRYAAYKSRRPRSFILCTVVAYGVGGDA